MKNAELKLIPEFMKNSRRSDRELARAIGVSQPTVSRFIDKLEKSGVIRVHYVTDFNKRALVGVRAQWRQEVEVHSGFRAEE